MKKLLFVLVFFLPFVWFWFSWLSRLVVVLADVCNSISIISMHVFAFVLLLIFIISRLPMHCIAVEKYSISS